MAVDGKMESEPLSVSRDGATGNESAVAYECGAVDLDVAVVSVTLGDG